MVISPSTKQKIDEIHHYQQQQMDLQKELYYEQKVMARRLSFLERMVIEICSSKKEDIIKPTSRPLTSLNPAQSLVAPMWSPIENVPSPNSWERRY